MAQVNVPNGIYLGTGVYVLAGNGDPNERVGDDAATAKPGSLYLRMDGGAGTSLYVKEPGGWVAK